MKAKKVILIAAIIAIILAVTIVIKILVLQNNLNPIIDVPVESLAAVLEEKERDTGVYQENGEDVLYIADSSDDGKGYEIVKVLDNDDVLMLIDEERSFRSIKQGSAVIVTDEYFCETYCGSDLFEIKVDENLNISYEVRRVEYVLRNEYYFSDLNSAISEKSEDIIKLQEKEYKELAYEFENVYGVSNKYDEPDTTDMIKLSFDYRTTSGLYDREYYISDDKIFYRLGYSADPTQWYEFTPDKCCNLDKINELLNELLSN